jgi:hypothetical protein
VFLRNAQNSTLGYTAGRWTQHLDSGRPVRPETAGSTSRPVHAQKICAFEHFFHKKQ